MLAGKAGTSPSRINSKIETPTSPHLPSTQVGGRVPALFAISIIDDAGSAWIPLSDRSP